jgi:hypothetical protein
MVQYENGVYANNELYTDAIAGGEHTFLKMLANKRVQQVRLMDQVLYRLTGEQLETCRQHDPVVQDFDGAIKHINVIPKTAIRDIKKGSSQAFPGAAVISIPRATAPEVFTYRLLAFFRVCDFKPMEYRMLPKMAVVKICGRLYVALNAVHIRAEAPIVVTLVD